MAALLAAAAALAAAPRPYQPPFGPWSRANGGHPILEPQRSGLEVAGVFNPAVVKDGSRYVMLYRAQDAQKTSRLLRAASDDGVHFVREAEPALVPQADYERRGGVEDPRLVKIGATWYLTYTAYDGKDAQLALATSPDLRHWERRGVIMPANKGRWNVHWTKSGAILDAALPLVVRFRCEGGLGLADEMDPVVAGRSAGARSSGHPGRDRA